MRIVVKWLALAILIGAAAAGTIATTPPTRASSCCEPIRWDASMIIPGQNSNNPAGPVGERALIHGEALPNQTLVIWLVAGDAVATGGAQFCGNARQSVALTNALAVPSSGHYDYAFYWPAKASSGQWSVCAYNNPSFAIAGSSVDGPFTVMATSAPAISVVSANVTAGIGVTVTGHNWLPAQAVNVFIGDLQACAVGSCNPFFPTVTNKSPIASTVAQSTATGGDFTVTLPIPATAPSGTFRVGAKSNSEVLYIEYPSTAQISIEALVPTVTPNPSPTAPDNIPSFFEALSRNAITVIAIIAGGLSLVAVLFTVIRLARRKPRGKYVATAAAVGDLARHGNRKVFISHAHEDNAVCVPLLEALKAWGVDYWFDYESMSAGSSLSERIQHAITERDIFVRVCTRAAQRSYWVKLETGAFRGLQAEEDKQESGTKRVLINLILDTNYVREPFDYAFVFIDAANRPAAAWQAELRPAIGIDASTRMLSTESARTAKLHTRGV
jgi:hypothetical protein